MANTNEPIAIDFGTTNSLAFGRQRDQVRVVPISPGEYGTQSGNEMPSYVGYKKGEIVVGASARNKVADDRYHVVSAVKRILGLTYEEYEKMEGNNVFGCEIVEKNGYPHFVIGEDGKTVSAIDVASEIFRKIKERACLYLDRDVSEAYVTVPATYNDKQVSAIREAAKKGGLNVVRMIKELSAASMAWFLDKELNIEIQGGEKIVVYDFGGGTFDVSLLHAISNKQFEILGKAGNCRLGGNDIDTQLKERLLEKYKTRASEEDVEKVVKALKNKKRDHVFRKNCEDVKISLSNKCDEYNDPKELLANSSRILIKVDIARNEEVPCTLQDLLDVSDPIVRETIRITKEMIPKSKKSNLRIKNIKHVIVVGGSSLLPSVKMQLQQLFPKATLHYKYGMNNRMEKEAVGRGAMNMVLADLENGEDYLNEKIECSFGIETKDGIVPMLLKGSNINCFNIRAFSNVNKEQDMIYTTVYKWYGDATPRKEDADCFVVKELAIRNRNYTGKEEGDQKFDFSLALDKQGCLTVKCRLVNDQDDVQLSSEKIENAYSCCLVCCETSFFQKSHFLST